VLPLCLTRTICINELLVNTDEADYFPKKNKSESRRCACGVPLRGCRIGIKKNGQDRPEGSTPSPVWTVASCGVAEPESSQVTVREGQRLIATVAPATVNPLDFPDPTGGQ